MSETDIEGKIAKPTDPDKAPTTSLEPDTKVVIPNPEPAPQPQAQQGNIKIIIDSELKVKQLQDRLGEIEKEKQDAIKRAEEAEKTAKEKEELLVSISEDAFEKEVDLVVSSLPKMPEEETKDMKERLYKRGPEGLEDFKKVISHLPTGTTSVQPLQPRKEVPGGQSTVQGQPTKTYPATGRGFEKMAYDMDEGQLDKAWEKYIGEMQKGRSTSSAVVDEEKEFKTKRRRIATPEV